ncbi:MAG TPA: Rad52/Rad22 family DNA repair protein [Alphaproteobacteria bacterium]|nr:Rad52/Rad22 family DNA repair protein [Alphaproteobacteria bacterium]
MDASKLCEPFSEADLRFFPAAVNRDRTQGRVAAYIDARAVMDRLDSAVGPESWSTSYRVVDEAAKAVECTLTISLPDGRSISRADIGYPNDAHDATDPAREPLKAAYSDALKRAAVQLGIGRYLYRLEFEQEWLPLDQYGKFRTPPRLKTGARSVLPTVRQPPATSETATATQPRKGFWQVTREMGFTDEQVIAVAMHRFGKAPAELTGDQRKLLVVALEEEHRQQSHCKHPDAAVTEHGEFVCRDCGLAGPELEAELKALNPASA